MIRALSGYPVIQWGGFIQFSSESFQQIPCILESLLPGQALHALSFIHLPWGRQETCEKYLPENAEETAPLTIILYQNLSFHSWTAPKGRSPIHNGKKSRVFNLFCFFGCNETMFDITSPR